MLLTLHQGGKQVEKSTSIDKFSQRKRGFKILVFHTAEIREQFVRSADRTLPSVLMLELKHRF